MSPDPRTILVVEDDAGIATLQRRRLERAGFTVRVASTVDEALATLAANTIDLVVLDYRLGETTGLDLHRRLKVSGVEVPVILVSAAIEDSAVVEALRAGVRDIVVKTPDYLDYLPDAVRGVLNQTAAADHGRGPQPRTRLLVVEDDPGTATLEQRGLERAGYRVTLAATAAEALAIVRGGDIGLAVIDLRLPDASGLEVYEQWKAEGLAVPAILVTGFADQMVAIRALRAGMRDFVPKTADFIEYLPDAVNRVVSEIRVERKLADSELRLASVVGTTLDAILMCDAESRIVLFNRAAEDLFGHGAADALQQPLARFIPGLTLGASAPDSGRFRERRELDAVRADGGTLPIEISASDVIISGERLFTVIARDISERRRAEAELREADRRKDEFLGMLAHELRNPLAAGMTAGEVLHRTVPDIPAAQKLIGVVRRQTRALSRMVDDLLDVSRVTLGKIQLTREPLLFGEVVSRAVDAIREAATRAGLQLNLRMDSEPLWLQGDLTRLEQVVTNLLANAIKFTAAGGTITVTVEGAGREAVLRVRDTGIGMPAGLVPRVFDLFVQGDTSLDRARSGLGIGLALVRQIVVRHGGTVTASSEGAGRGSEFVVRLPLATEDVRPMAEAPVADTAAGRSISVLVVDDQRDVADSVAMLIETFGHRARAVYDAAEALAISRRQAPDAMFVDIGMPGMTGYELAEHIRRDATLSHLQLVALTGYGRDEDRARVVRAGFDLHMTKPVTDADLHAVLATVASAIPR
jgi:PAS domain S-box-containing protein